MAELIKKVKNRINKVKYDFQRNKETKSIKKFKDLHKNGICFIIGNGPSMTFKDLDRINE